MKISIQPKQLYEGCIQAAITHAIAVGMYPELNYEHSWDNMNYCMNNAQGCKATITFHKKYVIGVFQDVDKIDCHKNALVFFDEAPEEVIKIAENETLQYVLENVNGVEKPVISAAFWGTWDKLYSLQSFDSIVENGGHIIRSQLLPFNEAMEEWRDYYDLDLKQISLIQKLFNETLGSNGEAVFLQDNEIELLYGDIDECLVSLGELNIFRRK